MTDAEYQRRLPEFRDVIGILFRRYLGHDPSPEQMDAYLAFCRNGGTGDQMADILSREPESIAYLAKPPVPPAPPTPPVPAFTVLGRNFVAPDGKRVVLSGVDGFMDFREYLNGGAAALTPFLDEANEFGFQARRVFMQGSIRQNTVMQLDPKEPGYYDKVRPFVELENSRGIIPILTIGIDNQDIQSPIMHWVTIDNLTKGTARIISFFNEWSKNKSTFNPEDIPEASGLWSRGSDQGNGVPRKPCGPVIEFHPVRNYTTAMRDAVASPIELYEVLGYTGALIIDEPGRMGTNAHDARFADPVEVERYARLLSTLCAGAVMHNHFGQRGLLMDDRTRACAKAWQRGMRV